MADYTMTLELGNKIIRIPVMPEKLTVKSPGKNESATVLKLGDVGIIRKKGLKEIAWSGLFPLHAAPYVTDRIQLSPMTYVRDIEAFRLSEEPGRLSIYGTDLGINMQVSIQSFEWEERAGEVGDIYYTISLRQWVDYSARTVDVQLYQSAAPAPRKTTKRGGSPAAQKTHTVVKGDCLWAIAQKYYNDGSKYPELYAKNKSTIDARNKGTGLPRYTIYPGQKLIL